MKKMSVVIVALALAASLSGIAEADNRSGMGGGCANCAEQGSVPSDPFRKFQADTIDLRQEMMVKRFELQRENLKGNPDEAKIAALKSDVAALQSKVLALRTQSGLPVDKCDGECDQMMGGFGKKGMAGCGKGTGWCNSGFCGGRK